MAIYKGDLVGDVMLYPGDDAFKLTSVSGNLSIFAKGAHLPALASVGRDVVIRAEHARLDALTSIGGTLSIGDTHVQLPNLRKVGEHLYIWARNTRLPSLAEVNGDRHILARGAYLPTLSSLKQDPLSALLATLRSIAGRSTQKDGSQSLTTPITVNLVTPVGWKAQAFWWLSKRRACGVVAAFGSRTFALGVEWFGGPQEARGIALIIGPFWFGIAIRTADDPTAAN